MSHWESLIPSGTSSQARRESQLPDTGTNAKKGMILWQEVELYFTVITYLGFAEISICVLPKCQGPRAPKRKAGKLHGLVSVGETAPLAGRVWRELHSSAGLLSAGEIVRVALPQLLPAETLETCF